MNTIQNVIKISYKVKFSHKYLNVTLKRYIQIRQVTHKDKRFRNLI